MNSLHEFFHGKHTSRQHSHSHDNAPAHNHGSRMMGFLGVARLLSHNSAWMSDYRTSKLVPASNKVIMGTIVVLLTGVVLWHVLPTGINNVALALIIAAAAHLAFLVAGGLIVSLFIRHQRTTARQMVIASIPWQGTEAVLDVGCGTGMLLNGCAQQLTTGKAIGIDLWQESIAGTPDVLLANAKAEGVSSKKVSAKGQRG